MDTVREAMVWAAFALDTLAVLVILATVPVALVRSGLVGSLVRADAREPGTIFKRKLVGGILLGVDLLVASDVIMTAAIEATLPNIAALGLLIVIRILLAWSLTVEVEGRWPWENRPQAGVLPAGDGDTAESRPTSGDST